jgi:DNA-directed RNA polymerase subunit RPC12/RpoP
MKVEYLKKEGNSYICPNCGSALHKENNNWPGEPEDNSYQEWYECFCGFRANK